MKNSYYGYGNILEANSGLVSPPTFDRQLAFQDIGLVSVSPVMPLTEIGTMKVVLKMMPKYIMTTLDSIARHGSEKHLRKVLILHSLCEKYNLYGDGVSPSELYPISQKRVFGEYFATDFLSFYIYKFLGDTIDLLYETYPDEAKKTAENLDLTFYERYPEYFLEFIPQDFQAEYKLNLQKSEILPYTKNDFNELDTVLRVLRACSKKAV